MSNEFVGCLRDPEKRAVFTFFEHLETAHPEEYGRNSVDGRSLRAAKAMVSGGDMAGRFGVAGRAECLAMRDVLDVLRKKHPRYAPPPAESDQIAHELTIAANKDG